MGHIESGVSVSYMTSGQETDRTGTHLMQQYDNIESLYIPL